MKPGDRPVILVADDDEDDCLLIREALKEKGFSGDVRYAYDGKELMEYLRLCVQQENPESASYPNLIVLDLNMPRKDGREALMEIKADPKFNNIPIAVLTTSDEQQDIVLCRNLGAASFTTKPASYEEWIRIMESICSHLL